MSGTGDARATVLRWRELSRSEVARHPVVLVVASFTAQPIAAPLGVALGDGADTVPDVRFADHNQVFQVCVDPDAHGVGSADEVVVIWRLEDVFERDFHAWGNLDPEAEARLVTGARSLGSAVAALSARHGASVIASDAPVPVGFGLDHADPELLTRLMALQAEVNAAFDAGLGDARVERLRLAALQAAAGTRATFDRRTWLMYRQPFAEDFVLEVGRAIADVVARRTAVPPKVVVLDCDGTLWDGVAVDDGIGGLDCSDAFPGFAFRSFQTAVQRLRHHGVLLALASKNDDDTVVRAFAELDGMVLTDDDVAARRVSWDPKPDGVASMAAELNLGLDAFVFVDDSDYEIGAMRTQLPMVRSLRVPEQIEELPDLLAETGWFRALRVTDDDRERTARYREEAGRHEAAAAMSHEEFLASLELRVRLLDVGPSELGRTTQLINKTNQFNLTTRRRDEAAVAAFVADPAAHVSAIAVDDRFGDYGIVGVVVGVRADDGWRLDTVLMSCRVLGRGVETAMLAGVIDRLRQIAPGPVAGEWTDSGRNHLVEDLLPRLGFDAVGAARAAPTDGVSYVLPADRTIDVPTHIELVRPTG